MFTFIRTSARVALLSAGTAGLVALGSGLATADAVAPLPAHASPYLPGLVELTDQAAAEVLGSTGLDGVLEQAPAVSERAVPQAERQAQHGADPGLSLQAPSLSDLVDQVVGLDGTVSPVSAQTARQRQSAPEVVPGTVTTPLEGVDAEVLGVKPPVEEQVLGLLTAL